MCRFFDPAKRFRGIKTQSSIIASHRNRTWMPLSAHVSRAGRWRLGDDRHKAERPPLCFSAGQRHDFMSVVLWVTITGSSGEPMPDLISAVELDLGLRLAANAMKS